MRYFSYRSQITFHPNDHSAFQDLADEIKAFEGLAHDSLVKYYGCEVHRVRTKKKFFNMIFCVMYSGEYDVIMLLVFSQVKLLP